MEREISTESQFIWKQLVLLLLTPFRLILVLLGQRPPSVLLEPIINTFTFIFESRITAALVILNIAAFIYQVLFMPEDLFHSLVFGPEQLRNLQFLPLFASMFLHASLLHISGNMLFLLAFGRIVEKRFDWGMLPMYLASGFISGVVSALFGESGIGASGAISGLIGVAILTDPFYFSYIVANIPLPIMVVGWLGIIGDIFGVLLPNSDNIAHFAHLGGYISVSVLVFFFSGEEKHRLKAGLIVNLVFVLTMGTFYLLYFR